METRSASWARKRCTGGPPAACGTSVPGPRTGREASKRCARATSCPSGWEKTFLSTIAGYLGEAVFRQGNLDEAERLSRSARSSARATTGYNEAVWRGLRARVYGARGDLDPAQALARQSVELAADVGFLDEAALTWLDLAEVLRTTGEEGAKAAAADALARVRAQRQPRRRGMGAGLPRRERGLTAAPASRDASMSEGALTRSRMIDCSM